MASFNTGSYRNRDLVQTAIDALIKQEYDQAGIPGYVGVNDSAVFNQTTTDMAAWITDLSKGGNLWSTTSEEADLPSYAPGVGQQATTSILNWNNSFDVPLRMFEDNMFDAFQREVRDFTDKAKITQLTNMMSLFRGAGSTTLTSDGIALISDSHVNLNGDTVDNRLNSLTLNLANLLTAMQMLQEQKDQSGTIRGHVPAVLLVPVALLPTAIELTESEWKPGVATNDISYISSKFPGLQVRSSQYLGAAAGGSDSNWFLLSRNHQIYRVTRKPITIDVVDYKTQRNNNYVVKGEFREAVTALSYEGIVGSV